MPPRNKDPRKKLRRQLANDNPKYADEIMEGRWDQSTAMQIMMKKLTNDLIYGSYRAAAAAKKKRKRKVKHETHDHR